MTQRKIIATLTLATALALTGCGGADEDGYTTLTGEDVAHADGAEDYIPPVPSPATYTPAMSSSDQTDLAFELTLRQQGLIPTYGGVPDSIRLGHSVCTALTAGSSDDQVAGVLQDNGYDFEDAWFFLGVATSAYCPQEG